MTNVWVSRGNRKTVDVSEYIDGATCSGDYATFNIMIYGDPV